MKRLTLTAILIMVMGVAMASGDSSKTKRATIVHFPGDKIKVFYTAPGESIVKIRLRDDSGRLLRTDRIKSENGFMQPYNFSTLEKGIYFVELTDEFGVLSEKVELTGTTTNSRMVVKELEDNKYRLIVDHNKRMPLSLTIYNSSNEVIHKENYKDQKGFTRVYDLSKFDSGNFTFELVDKSSTRTVSVE